MKLKFSDNNDRRSLSYRFRFKRFLVFLSLLDKLPRPLSMLDVGGTQQYWNMMGFNDPQVSITLLNLSKQETSGMNIKSVAGDATDLLSFGDRSIDVVYSNSVIEHLYTKAAQLKMANEIRRVGKNYFIQTPNYFFFLEPHWVFPFFQFLPKALRVRLTQRLNLGHIGRIKNYEAAKKQVDEINLLTKKEMQELFPEATIYEEKLLFFTKSIVAYHFPGS